ncbi:MAG: DUF5011 domain-containing protein [Bacteroidetes bacterium]|nr:DUF5011 domain-containing protein [Bacteroidota bacterium]
MKKLHIIVLSALIIGLFMFQSCKKKEDRIDPVLSLIGDSLITLDSTYYVEFGATAYDEEDGELVPLITNSIYLTKVGSNEVKYTAYDNAGNRASIIRKVKVNNFSKSLAGLYQLHQVNLDSLGNGIDSLDYTQTMTASTIYNWNLIFGNFWLKNNYLNKTKYIMSAYINKLNGTVSVVKSPASVEKFGLEVVVIDNFNRIQVRHYFNGKGSIDANNKCFINVKDSIVNQYQYKPTATAIFKDTTITYTEKHYRLTLMK